MEKDFKLPSLSKKHEGLINTISTVVIINKKVVILKADIQAYKIWSEKKNWGMTLTP